MAIFLEIGNKSALLGVLSQNVSIQSSVTLTETLLGDRWPFTYNGDW